jgi:hypothetical protein
MILFDMALLLYSTAQPWSLGLVSLVEPLRYNCGDESAVRPVRGEATLFAGRHSGSPQRLSEVERRSAGVSRYAPPED